MYKLTLIEEGMKEELIKGNLATIINFLKENEEIYNWVQDEDPEMELPELSGVETAKECKKELEKVNLGWWGLVLTSSKNNKEE